MHHFISLPHRYRQPSGPVFRCLGLLLALLAGTSTSVAANTDDIESTENIRLAAEQFVREELEIANDSADVRLEIGRLDNRLRLTRCASDLEARFAPGARRDGNTAVQVRCPGPVTWSLYVPANIERYTHVVVASRSLQRQQTLLPGDLRLQRLETSRHAGSYYEDPSDLIGQQTRRSIRPGQIIGAQHVTQREVVRRGQRVTLLSGNGSVAIRMQGEALEGGTLGERIRVKNTSSGRVVEGEVQPNGQVRITL